MAFEHWKKFDFLGHCLREQKNGEFKQESIAGTVSAPDIKYAKDRLKHGGVWPIVVMPISR